MKPISQTYEKIYINHTQDHHILGGNPFHSERKNNKTNFEQIHQRN